MIESISLTCEFLHDRTVNFAMQQNHVPVVKRFRITNASNYDLGNLKVKITAEPEFASVWEMTVASIPAGQTVDLGVVDLQLSPVYLAGLTERIEGRLFVTIFKDDSLIYSSQSPIAVLAYDEWNGSQTLPEIIAAFVTPNHPEVAKILRKAADILKEWKGSPSLDGYQSKDPIRVRKQLAAIYAALQQQNITYCVPPASFEEQGQKIRMPDVIQEFHLATCLDLTVLFAACTEAAGLNPLIIFIKGHAFPGAWLVKESFSESLQDDVTLLTKRIAPGVQEICVLESTAITSGPNCSFDDAVALGENILRNSEDFHFFVDVRRARASQIRPLPLRSQGRLTVDDKKPPLETPITYPAPEDVEKPILITPEDKNEGERTRLEQWERRLLEQLRQLQEEESFLSSASDRAREMIGSLWRDGNADWDLVANACVWTANLRKLAADIAGTDLEYLGRLRENWSRTMTEFREQLGLDGAYSKQLNSYIDGYNAFAAAWQAFVQLAMLDQEVLAGSKNDRNWFRKILEQIRLWEENLDGVRDWCAWRRIRTEALDAGLEPLVKSYEMGELAHDQVEPAFLRGFYQAWIESELANDTVLSSFSRGLFEDKIRQFRELDETFAQLTRQEVYARLAARLPQLNGDTLQNSEMGILQREILKQRNHMALRQLFSKIPNLLTRLKPCLLMSPIAARDRPSRRSYCFRPKGERG